MAIVAFKTLAIASLTVSMAGTLSYTGLLSRFLTSRPWYAIQSTVTPAKVRNLDMAVEMVTAIACWWVDLRRLLSYNVGLRVYQDHTRLLHRSSFYGFRRRRRTSCLNLSKVLLLKGMAMVANSSATIAPSKQQLFRWYWAVSSDIIGQHGHGK